MKLIYSLLAAQAALADYTIEMRLCTDTNESNGMAREAVGKKGAFYIQLQGGIRERVNLPYNVRGSSVMKTRLKGDLETSDWVSLDYDQRDILCLEMVRLTTIPVVKGGVKKSYNIIQDYDPFAWDMTKGDQSWTSSTNKKVSYWTKDCIEDTRYLTTVSHQLIAPDSNCFY